MHFAQRGRSRQNAWDGGGFGAIWYTIGALIRDGKFHDKLYGRKEG